MMCYLLSPNEDSLKARITSKVVSCSSHLSVVKSYYSPVFLIVKNVSKKVQSRSYRKYGHQHRQDLGKYKHFHLIHGLNVQRRSGCLDVLPEGVLLLLEQR